MIRKLTLRQRLSYRNKGADTRPLGSVGGFFQGLLSIPFDWKSTPPRKLFQINKSVVYIWPPFVAINVQQGGYVTHNFVDQGDGYCQHPLDESTVCGKDRAAHPVWRTFRAGWRWDPDPGYMGYIADVIVKLREEQAHI